ncbi:MAG: SBBP repeat-containing protein [Promethearchaeota archaeon]
MGIKSKYFVELFTCTLIIIILMNIIYYCPVQPISIDKTYLDDIDNLNTSIKKDWEKSIDNGGIDEGQSVITDDLGNVYITGKSYQTSKSCYDIITRKYNNSGSLLWNRIWGGNADDLGYGVALDNLYNVYVAGWTMSYGNGSNDIVIIKYNSSGDIQWNKTWGGSEWDTGNDISIDSSNNIYISGYTESIGENGDLLLLKYNDQGILQWNTTWGNNRTDLAYGLTTDLEGNVYVTGYTEKNSSFFSEIVLLKFNSSKGLEWNNTWGGPLQEEGFDVVLDSNNNSYVIGRTKSFGTGGYSVAVLKFNKTGALDWNITWGGNNNDNGYGIDLTAKNELIITGSTRSFEEINFGDFFLLKCNLSGSEIWNKTWGTANLDIGYDIVSDSFENIYITGIKNDDLSLIKFLPYPDNFILSSDADNPDSDGSFRLSWTYSLEAENYSIYQDNQSISKVNNTMKIKSGITNLSHSFTYLPQGDYYFIIVAFNTYGNTSSNCLKIVVKYPPGGFMLSHNADIPDGDGNFSLNWSVSARADNYSLYRHSSFIKDIDNNGTLIASGLINRSFNFFNLNNSNYYYIIVAYNEAGKNLSNCIDIIIRRYPTSFNFSIDADSPDDDGRFYLIWTPSNFTDNYSIFYSFQPITQINESVFILEKGIEQSDNPLFIPDQYILEYYDWDDGTYYFIIVAYNPYGNFTSDCLKLEIDFPHENDKAKEDSRSSKKSFPIYEILIVILFIGLLSIFIVVAKLKDKKRTYVSIR